jgi:predicted nucleic acid-binding protein
MPCWSTPRCGSITFVAAIVEEQRLMGRGIGWIDAHLLDSALHADFPLWTRDKRLASVAANVGISAAP